MPGYILNDYGDVIGYNYPSNAELDAIIEDTKKQINKQIQLLNKKSNKRNWIRSNRRRKK